MSALRHALGYAWAAAAFALALAAIASHERLGGSLAAGGLRVSPVLSGGEVARTVEHGRYRTLLHRPVFDSLFGEQGTGFVQVDWGPLEALPPRLAETVDLDVDGKADFTAELDTVALRLRLEPLDCRVLSAGRVQRLELPRRVRLYRTPEPVRMPDSMRKLSVRIALRRDCARR